jgi:glycosyltransferase involved in cell wall biosynthesis
MTAGVPVVAANRGALPEVLAGAGVLIDPDDAVDLANGLRRLYSDDGLAAVCVAAGLARSGEYRWSDTAARACEAYRQALARRSAPGRR